MGAFNFMCCSAPKVDDPLEPDPKMDDAIGAPSTDLVTYPPPPTVKVVPGRPKVQWVVGLDFGTTFSGFAYARASGEEKSSTFYDWPGAPKPYCKTLTGIFYKQTAPGVFQCQSWGYPAYADNVADSRSAFPSGLYLSRFKLLLKRDLDDPILASSIPPPLTLDTVITDYLRHIGELALQKIRGHEGDASFKRETVHWCVTVPAIWEESAKQRMKACMVSAGLVTSEMGGMGAVSVVLEPEAASFHCHQMLQKELKDLSGPRESVRLDTRDRILVVDVGGGTVDIVVQEILRTGSDYRVQELTESSGGLCGGSFVDASFLRFLFRKIGCLEEFLNSGVPSYRTRLLKDWEDVKCAFGSETNSTATTDIILHHRLAPMWEAHDEALSLPARESYTEIELTQEDLRSIFDPVVNEIMELIAVQLMLVKDIKVIFAVGGFAGSPYLLQRIKARFSSEVRHIVCPPYPGSAIVQGAVSLARNPNGYDVSRISRKTYGSGCVMRGFTPGVDPAHLEYVEEDGTRHCQDRFDIFVKRGERVEVNQVITKMYEPLCANLNSLRFDLFSSDELEPRYCEGPNVTKEGGFSVPLPKGYSMDSPPGFNFSIYFGRSSIEIKVEALEEFEQAHGEKVNSLQLPITYHR